MGLDAAVYRSSDKMTIDPVSVGLQLNQATGEWYSEDGKLPLKISASQITAVEKRLGNVTLIAALAAEANALLPRESILISSVLYDGAHAGDVLSGDQVLRLKNEISTLKSLPISTELAHFLADMWELAAAAEENKNPIVFV
jgi:hypothetical protein